MSQYYPNGSQLLGIVGGSRTNQKLGIPGTVAGDHLAAFSDNGCEVDYRRSAGHLDTAVSRQAVLKCASDYRILSYSDSVGRFDDRDLYSGLIRLHVLHHACEGPIFGLGIVEELARHGYRISPGTLYPILYGLEKKGYLRSTEQRDGKSLRKIYQATPLGRKALEVAKDKISELFREIIGTR